MDKSMSIYKPEWIEKEAQDGFNKFFDMLQHCSQGTGILQEKLKDPDVKSFLHTLYCTAFHDAINTFVFQVLEDEVTEIDMCVDKLGKVTAGLHDKE